ncbi:MAG: hypothetical protein ACYTG0_15880 [Planctomycetota bacterium]|jgi:hypothetical protein
MSVPPEVPQPGPTPAEAIQPAGQPTPQRVLEFLESKNGRWLSPGSLIFALLLSCLPWVNVQCQNETMLTQSGIQAATGGYSEGDLIHQMKMMGEEMGGGDSEEETEEVRAAPLMILWFLFMLAGVGLGIAGVTRGVSFGIPGAAACGGVAALLLQIQVFCGFPVEDDVKESMKDNPAAGAQQLPGMPGSGAGDMPVQPPGAAEFQNIAQEAMIKVRYTAWLWIAWLATLIPPILCGAEWKLKTDLARGAPPPPPGAP